MRSAEEIMQEVDTEIAKGYGDKYSSTVRSNQGLAKVLKACLEVLIDIRSALYSDDVSRIGE